jgi:hypothetical protein
MSCGAARAASTRGVLPARVGSASQFREYDRGVHRLALALGVLLVAGGLVWIAQGLNLPFAPRSFMTADRAWVLIGTITAFGGGLLVGWARRQS